MAETTMPRLTDALGAIEDGIYIINDDFVITYMNKAMVSLFGEGMEKKCYSVINNERGVCPWCRAGQVFDRQKTLHGEMFLPRLHKFFHVISIPVTSRNGSRSQLMIYRDITRAKAQEARLRSSEENYRRLFNNVGCGVFTSSKQGRFLDVNPALLAMLGYEDKEEFLGLDLATQVYRDPSDRKAYQDIVEKKGKVVDYEVKWKKRDGSIIQVLMTTHVRYDDTGNVLGYEGIIVDLDERLRMERKLNETRQHLLQSEKLAAMGRLTSQIAHELNNPLFGIMNTLELMKTEITPESKRRRLLDMSLSETERLADMLKKMLTFSTPDQVERVNINVNTILEEILLLYEKRFRENSIKIATLFMEAPGHVCASKDQLRQVFLNMFSNALDAMPNGGRLTLATTQDGRGIKIDISDTGVGIEEAHLEKIFDSFFTTKRESVKGVGLGLSVCYGFIKDHGGDITVKSIPGKGTTFTISLPLAGQP
ncbi:MAG: PAS domain S-box protein [Desulfobacteraceae bacterium]|nr:PAS domain S-box protein [Desulfobacteraceae bacterium]